MDEAGGATGRDGASAPASAARKKAAWAVRAAAGTGWGDRLGRSGRIVLMPTGLTKPV